MGSPGGPLGHLLCRGLSQCPFFVFPTRWLWWGLNLLITRRMFYHQTTLPIYIHCIRRSKQSEKDNLKKCISSESVISPCICDIFGLLRCIDYSYVHIIIFITVTSSQNNINKELMLNSDMVEPTAAEGNC